MPKTKATKTINPLHFEDLEPHRFEDLVRRLLYGFRDWRDIEPTGRAGSDEGFDVRAWEKGDVVTNVDEENNEGIHAFDGRLWQIQGKREKSITPSRMRELIKDGVDEKHPPYGYILAAATNVSKSTYDVFREELKKKGVAEFYFWGKDYLEDQLSLPQNDEILFTFFGISLSPRRRSRVAEVKFDINNKNKILKIVFGNEHLLGQQVPRGKHLFLRDIKDKFYPYKNRYQDFEKNRRWEEQEIVDVSPNGVLFKIRERYAYLDLAKQEWDFSGKIDLCPRKENIDSQNRLRLDDEGKRAERFWRHLPQRFQAKLILYGFVAFEDMLIIDDKGDPENTDPHIYIDFGSNGPFRYTFANIFQGHNKGMHEVEFRKFKKVKIFPPEFPNSKMGKTHEAELLGDTDQLRYSRGASKHYYFDDRLKDVAAGDIIHISRGTGERDYEKHLEVTYIEEAAVADVIKEHGEYIRAQLARNTGREIKDTDKVQVCELHEISLLSGSDTLFYCEDTWGL